jgi:(1->4)-alpha-D-glucan 1-alpha-D-glucosylmutase
LAKDRSGEFISDFSQFAERAALLGTLNSLSQITLKTLSPGVPDFFQGTELFDFSLVDPDNRRLVDYGLRGKYLGEGADGPDLAAHWQDGRIKFALTRKLLHIRNTYAELFRDGSYERIAAEGNDAGHVVAFARSRGKQRIVVVVGRHFAALTSGGRNWPAGWRGHVKTRLANGIDLICDRPVDDTGDLKELFQYLPVTVIASRT